MIKRLLIILIIMHCFAIPVIAQEKLVFSTVQPSPIVTVCENVVKEAYQRIGVDVQVIKYPAARALKMAESGKTDGELFRIAGLDQRFKNLIMIPLSVYTMEGVAVTKGISFPVTGRESLKPYKVGRVFGVIWAEKFAKGLNEHGVHDNETLITVLDKGRVDVILASRLTLLSVTKKFDIKDFKVLSPPIASIPLYHYLNKRHEALVPRITSAVQEMEKTGRIKEIKEEMAASLQ